MSEWPLTMAALERSSAANLNDPTFHRLSETSTRQKRG
jgi:hypothetical protein